MLRRCFGLLEGFAEVLWIDFRFLETDFRILETDFRFLETSGTEFWLPEDLFPHPGDLWDRVLAS